MSDWRLMVLGVGQDGGRPQLGCRKSCCERARHGLATVEHAACVAITDGRRHWLIDATPRMGHQLRLMDAHRPDGVFLTHAHYGHYAGLAYLGKEVLGALAIPVWCTPAMRDFLAGNAPWSQLVADGNVDCRTAAEITIGPVVVRRVPVPHRNEFADTVGYRIDGPRGKVLYIPDIDRWEDWDRDLREEVGQVDVALLDGTFYAPDELDHRDMAEIPHPLVTDTMDRLEGLGDKVWFTHMNHTNPVLDEPVLVTGRGFARARAGQSFAL